MMATKVIRSSVSAEADTALARRIAHEASDIFHAELGRVLANLRGAHTGFPWAHPAPGKPKVLP